MKLLLCFFDWLTGRAALKLEVLASDHDYACAMDECRRLREENERLRMMLKQHARAVYDDMCRIEEQVRTALPVAPSSSAILAAPLSSLTREAM